jgi:hypothetical protein
MVSVSPPEKSVDEDEVLAAESTLAITRWLKLGPVLGGIAAVSPKATRGLWTGLWW